MDIQEINKLLKPYGISCIGLKPLDGYESENYKIKGTDGAQYVFKYYRDPALYHIVNAEAEIIHAIAPQVSFAMTDAKAVGDKLLFQYEDGSFGRLMPFIEGEFLAQSVQSIELVKSFGRATASLNKALYGFKSDAIAARVIRWDIKHVSMSRRAIRFIDDHRVRSLVSYFMHQYEQKVVPQFYELRQSIIHGDLNDWNVLIDGDEIKGVLDFGDCVHSSLINEIAVALCYLCMDKEDPIDVAAAYLRAYHEVYPLLKSEVEILYYLIAARMCISLCSSAEQSAQGVEKDYIFISEKPVKRLIEQWLSFNPDAVAARWMQAIDLAINQIDRATVQKKRIKYFSTAVSLSYSQPIQMTSAAFQYMYGDGRTYLDAYNNIPHVGHSHPAVTQAIARQAAKLNTNTRYHYDLLTEYAEKLLKYFPGEMDKVFFVNSGSEATDLAWRLAYAYRGRRHRLVLEHGYHGHTNLGVSVSAYKFDGRGGQGLPENTSKLSLPQAYRGKYSTVEEFLHEAMDEMTRLDEAGIHIAAMAAEPISGCGGQVPLLAGYLRKMKEALAEREALLIVDEVQTGFGRLGHHFWGFEMQGVTPDIIVLGKPIANGHPMGAVVTSSRVVERFETGMEFFSSFGGNPVSCAAGLAVLNTLEEEGLVMQAAAVGDYWIESLHKLSMSDPRIGDVRGMGLFIGVEIFNPDDDTPDTATAAFIKNQMKERGVLCSTDGPYDNVLKMKPPLCFSKNNVDTFMYHLSEIMSLR